MDMDDSVLAAGVDDDILLYLQANLSPSIVSLYSSELVQKAEGLFQWAAVACDYIHRPSAGLTPRDCIRRLLMPSKMDKAPNHLDRLYLTVLTAQFDMDDGLIRCRFHSVMGLVLASFEPLSMDDLVVMHKYVVDDDDEVVSAIVGPMGPLLSNVTHPVSSLPVVPLHSSFRDFLVDKRRSSKFHINLTEAHFHLLSLSLRIMQDDLHFNICGLETSHFSNHDLLKIGACVPGHFSYVCRFWGDHLQRVPFNINTANSLMLIFETQLLFWLEALSVIGEMALAAPTLISLKAWLLTAQDFSNPKSQLYAFGQLVEDSLSFVRYFGVPMAESAPHIYLSALPFAPISSLIYRLYAHRFPNTLSLAQGQLTNWPALTTTFDLYGVSCLAFSPDHQHLASGMFDGEISIWNTTTGQKVVGPKFDHSEIGTWLVTSVTFSPDGHYVASGSFCGGILVRKSTTRQLQGRLFSGHTCPVLSLAFSLDSRLMASGSADMTIRIWNVGTGTTVAGPFTGHPNPVWSLEFLPSTTPYVVSYSGDRTVHVWDISSGKLIKPSSLPPGFRIAIPISLQTEFTETELEEEVPESWENEECIRVWSHDKWRFAMSRRWDKTIHVWDLVTRSKMAEFTCDEGVASLAFSADSHSIAAASTDGRTRIWNIVVDTRAILQRQKVFGKSSCLVFSSRGDSLTSDWRDHSGKMTMHIWDSITGELVDGPFSDDDELDDAQAHSKEILTVKDSGGKDHATVVCSAFSPNGECVKLLLYNNEIYLDKELDALLGLSLLIDFPPSAMRVTLNANNDLVITLQTGEVTVLAKFSVPNMLLEKLQPYMAKCSLSGQNIAVATFDEKQAIYIFDATTRAKVAGPFIGHSSFTCAVAFSPGGRLFAFASYDQTIRIWDFRAANLETVSDDAVSFTDHSAIDDHGWIRGENDELVMWIPDIHRLGLHRPSTAAVANAHQTKLDLSRFVNGRNWWHVYDGRPVDTYRVFSPLHDADDLR